MPRARLLGAQLLAFIVALGAFAVTATACEGGGGGGKELTSLSTSLSGGGKEGESISVVEGTKVKDKATLTGKNASKATGKVTYNVYSESGCKTVVKAAGEVTVSGESVPASSEEELEAPKTYYWQAHYGGDENNDESTSPCTEVLTVKAKTALATKLSGESKEGESLTVLEGAGVKDKATLSGTGVSSAGGKVKYTDYSGSLCAGTGSSAGEVTVTSGSVPESSEETLGAGVHSWRASYGGDSLHEPSESGCDVETVNSKPGSEPKTKEIEKCNPANPNLEIECEGDPVNNADGSLTEEQTDLSIGGRGPGLRITRAYSSLSAAAASEAGPWGFGWTGPYDARLELDSENGTATVYQEGGATAEFYTSGSEYTQGGWTQARLVKEGSNYVYTLPNQDELEFNSEGRLVKETERDGNSNTMTYNGSHQLEKVTDGDSRSLTFKYDSEGQVESITDPLSHVIKYAYEAGNLKSVTIEGKVRWEFTYESPHLLTKLKDGREHITTNKYNGSHQVTEQEVAGHKRKWEYKTGETKITEPNTSETLETFNSAGEPTKTTRAKGKSEETTTEYEYEASTFARIKMKDGNGHEWKYGYDGEGNKTSEKDPNGDERKWAYDKKHDVETETTPEGETTTYKLNSKGLPEVIERPVGAETQKTEYKYDAKGDLEEEIDPLGDKTKYTYDAAGDKETETDPEGDERTWKYNADSQVTEEKSPRGFTTKIERNEYGLPTKITDPLGHTTEYKYDGDQNIESETDGNKHTTKYEYNEENLRTKTTEANGDTTETGYDAEGKMTSHIDGNKHVWEYKRNALEQVTEEENPLKKIWKRTYDKAGNLKTLEDPEKHTTEYVYDNSNRLEKIKYSTGKPSEVTLEYTKDGRVKTMTDETGTTENTWDKLDRLTKYKSGAGKTVEYEYNLANEPKKITYPNGEHITREYDKDNRLEKVTDWKSNITSFKYNKDSQLEKTTFPGTENEDTYGYNEADQMSEVHYKHGATSLGTLVYERDGDGQVKKTTATVLPGPATSESTLDENSRLIEANKLAYKYDKANNPEEIEGTTGYGYNEADELEKGGGDTYTYNEDGQRAKAKPTTGPTTTYTYDQAGNLTNVERPKEGETSEINDSYTYDGDNLRQTQTINGTKTNLIWDTAETLPIIVSDETNSYIYGPEGLPIEQIPSSGEPLFLHHDQQGSTRLLTNKTGTTETAYTYDPYGRLNASTGTASTPLRYDGQYTSTDTGLIYLRARTYDPNATQFLTIDPALEATGEPYAYTKDSPEASGDPTGDCQADPDLCADLAGLEDDAHRKVSMLERRATADYGTMKSYQRELDAPWAWLYKDLQDRENLRNAIWDLGQDAADAENAADAWQEHATFLEGVQRSLGCFAVV